MMRRRNKHRRALLIIEGLEGEIAEMKVLLTKYHQSVLRALGGDSKHEHSK